MLDLSFFRTLQIKARPGVVLPTFCCPLSYSAPKSQDSRGATCWPMCGQVATRATPKAPLEIRPLFAPHLGKQALGKITNAIPY